MIDMDLLAKGANFKELKESYVIFICKTDPFDLGEPCYKTKTIFENHPEKEFDDKTHKVFYNASAYKKENDPEIYAFLHYISTNIPEDDFTNEIFDKVEANKRNEQFRSDYMRCNIHDFDIMEEGKELGKELGRTEAKLEAARNMLLQEVDADKIALWLALPLETVQQLAEELKIKA
ncbi:MAG: Rpn family recombination-promoting nuclease/putative transposase [Spirochaetaceae bacterium]|nr:Rpn family recombination-promoting nuclease/putative transposase [Spirochaetaceae bacterium]